MLRRYRPARPGTNPGCDPGRKCRPRNRSRLQNDMANDRLIGPATTPTSGMRRNERLRQAATIPGPAASARQGHSAGDQVRLIYGYIPQWTCSPHLNHTRPRHHAIQKWQCRGLKVNMSRRSGFPYRPVITLTTLRPRPAPETPLRGAPGCGNGPLRRTRHPVRKRRKAQTGTRS